MSSRMDDIEHRLKRLEDAFGKKIVLEAAVAPSESDETTKDHQQTTDKMNNGRQIKAPKPAAHKPTSAPYDATACLRYDPQEDPFDSGRFAAGETTGQNTAFCPWRSVLNYPHNFVGKGNKENVTREFAKIFEDRVWDFFYLHDVTKPDGKPYLFVPTDQFVIFLDDINAKLNIQLRIPDRGNLARFLVRFDQERMPRPRYLKRATESADIELEDGEWPAAHADDIEAFQAAVAIWKDDWTRKLGYARASPMSEDKKRKAKERSQQKRADRDRMLLETQVSLGIKEDPAAEASQGPVSHPVFICFDIEAIERPPNPVSEVGIAIFDSRVANNKAVPRGTCGRGWWPSIQAHHLRVKEYSGLVNHDFVKGCPGAFDFGKSTFPTRNQLTAAIDRVLKPYLDKSRAIVLVGHDIEQDLRYLESVGMRIRELKGASRMADSQLLHQSWKQDNNGRGLSSVLADLGIESRNLHNAGNDAVYTLRALMGVAIETHRQQEVEAAGGTYEPPF